MPESNDAGWVTEPANPAEAQRAYATVVDCIRRHIDATGRRLAETLEECPDPEADPEYYEKVEKPTSLSAISQRIQEGEYLKATDFEMDMLQLFENARGFTPSVPSFTETQLYFKDCTTRSPRPSHLGTNRLPLRQC